MNVKEIADHLLENKLHILSILGYIFGARGEESASREVHKLCGPLSLLTSWNTDILATYCTVCRCRAKHLRYVLFP